jgi:hypothetical protein
MTSTTSPPGAGPAVSASPPAFGVLTHRQILTILSGLMMGMFLASLPDDRQHGDPDHLR